MEMTEDVMKPLSVLLSKQNYLGRWILERTPTGRMQADLEANGKESKLVTLNVMSALK
jgi:hypothetical protein